MAFEIIHSPRNFAGQPPVRRLSSRLATAAAVLALIWACVVAYQAQPIDSEQGWPADAQRIGADR
jgi:hypothetical protein